MHTTLVKLVCDTEESTFPITLQNPGMKVFLGAIPVAIAPERVSRHSWRNVPLPFRKENVQRFPREGFFLFYLYLHKLSFFAAIEEGGDSRSPGIEANCTVLRGPAQDPFPSTPASISGFRPEGASPIALGNRFGQSPWATTQQKLKTPFFV